MPTSSFDYTLPNLNKTVKVILPHNLTEEQLRTFPAFKKWINTLTASLKLQEHKDHKFHSSPYNIKDIDVQSIVEFGPGKPGFVKIQVTVENGNKEWLPGAVFLRGGSVAMLV
jgi:ADP-sugar diphosphatase